MTKVIKNNELAISQNWIFDMIVLYYTWACQKQFPILNLQYGKDKFTFDADFL